MDAKAVYLAIETQWARNGFEFFEEQRQKPIEGMKLGQKVYGKQGSSKS